MVKNMNRTKKAYSKPGIVFENFLTGELTGTPEMVEKIKSAVASEIDDIFEKLKKSIGCTYISDLKDEPYCTEAKTLLKAMDLEEYSLEELNDIACYLYGMQFSTQELALTFLRS